MYQFTKKLRLSSNDLGKLSWISSKISDINRYFLEFVIEKKLWVSSKDSRKKSRISLKDHKKRKRKAYFIKGLQILAKDCMKKGEYISNLKKIQCQKMIKTIQILSNIMIKMWISSKDQTKKWNKSKNCRKTQIL